MPELDETGGAVERLRAELAESQAAARDLADRYKLDLRRAEARTRRLGEKLQAALDEGHGVYFSTDLGRWEPRRGPLTVTVTGDAVEDARLAHRRMWGCDPQEAAAA